MIKILILIVLLVDESVGFSCINKYCECNSLDNDNNSTYNVECTETTINHKDPFQQINDIKTINSLRIHKISINLILNSSFEIHALDLSFNKLEDDDIQIVNQFESLIELNLSHNDLLKLRQDQFRKLAKLEILDLSFNQIYYIELNASRKLNLLKIK